MSYKFTAHIRAILLSFALIVSMLGLSGVSFAQTGDAASDAPAAAPLEAAQQSAPTPAPLPAAKTVAPDSDLDLSESNLMPRQRLRQRKA